MKKLLPVILIISVLLFGCSNNNEKKEDTKPSAEITTSNENTYQTAKESNTPKETSSRIEYMAFMFGELPAIIVIDKEKDIYFTLLLQHGNTNESLQKYIDKENVNELYSDPEHPIVKGDNNNYVIRNSDNTYTIKMSQFKYSVKVTPSKDSPQISELKWE